MKRKELLFLALLVAVLCVWAFWPRQTGDAVTVTINGEEYGRYSLDRARRLELEGYGGYTLTLVIEDGAAHVEDASCPDLICQNHAAISGTGEQIVCLPARIVITVTGEEAQADAVAQ